MTESEAIKICNTIGFATSFSNPQGIPLNTTKDELAEAMRIAIQALEKRIPKKPNKTIDSSWGIKKEHCVKVGADNVKTARSMIHPQYADRFIRQYILDEEIWRGKQ